MQWPPQGRGPYGVGWHQPEYYWSPMGAAEFERRDAQNYAETHNPSTSSSSAHPLDWYDLTMVIIYAVWWAMDVDVMMPGFLARICE